MRRQLFADAGDPPVRVFMRLAWLVVLVVFVAIAKGGNRAAELPLLVVAAAGWLVWAAWPARRRPLRAAIGLLTLAVAGGLVCLWTPVAVGFLAAASVGAATVLELPITILVALAGPAVLAVASWWHGWSAGLVAGATVASLAGLAGGLGRRQAEQRSQQAARTEIAREIHDVLAHTLSALAVQLEAAEAVLESGNTDRLATLVRRSRRLVANGLDETAAAVRTLRDEPVAIADQLAQLVAAEQIPFHVEGTPRALPPKAGLALYRAVQEALTNARKHAPGAPAAVSLSFGPDTTVVTVTSGHADAPARATGAGLGIQGMRERLELVGGSLTAGSSADGWIVKATVST